MIRYRNLSGNSGVASYRVREDAIEVRFHENPSTYVYSFRRPGREHVETMKQLARSGRGLSSYISQYVRDDYDVRH